MEVEELTDIFYTSDKKGQVCRVKLNGQGFTLQRETTNNRSREQLIGLDDIVGSRCIVVKKDRRGCSMLCSSAAQNDGNRSDSGDDTKKKYNAVTFQHNDASAYLYVFAYILNKKHLRNIIRRERTVLKLRFRSFDTFGDNMREAERWYHTVRAFKGRSLGYNDIDERRILVLLNPKSGSGKAREIFNRQVVPVLNEAEQPYDLHVTKHANYAREFVRVKVLDNYSGIVAVGGDGLFFEILNGLLMRADWLDARNILLGIVPCGSGNGLARSIAHVCGEPYEPKPILGATLTMLSGKSMAMDVVRIQQQNQILYSFLSVGWGLISDIDIESERLRSLGYQRFTIWTLHRLISLRTYRGKVSYLPKENVYMESDTISLAEPLPLKHSRSCNTCLDTLNSGCFQSTDCIEASKYYDVISLQNSINQSLKSRCDSWFSPASCRSTYHSVSESIYHSVDGGSDAESHLQHSNLSVHLCGPTGSAPTLNEPVPASWVVEEGEFVMVHAAYQTHLGSDCFFVPQAKFNDGIIYVVIIRSGISRSQLLNFLMGMSSGTHVPVTNNEFVKMVPVTALRIEPYDNEGILTVDGERIEFGPLQAELLPSMVRVMAPK
ncbi:sphingosine kinase 1 [Bactrocera neohumeralis]|uniref:sphingosine kinase 1 n=1 Tax=Bactrocera neohumeralis TaxID=98809 RepID=UPI002166168C|nr:sphingosine kinase 1 [Bactrocera neohumeralis]XP_050334165.1 sphingosine kinase 1 [Bactrocera neohumeralis]XP_050334166.1 sphingosine kinase 1 [Bactrocera neohumeralis]XP_050334167.1 sphingosine kinase 1 [Bactrocera neohumeralis]